MRHASGGPKKKKLQHIPPQRVRRAHKQYIPAKLLVLLLDRSEPLRVGRLLEHHYLGGWQVMAQNLGRVGAVGQNDVDRFCGSDGATQLLRRVVIQ